MWVSMAPEIAEAVNKVMGSIKGLEKRGKNEFHRYKFATIGDLMIELQPALVDAGLFVLQSQQSLQEMAGAMVVVYNFGLAHKSGAVWMCPVTHTGMAAMYNSKGGVDDKAINKCHTAARKYFMLGLFQIPVLEEGDERLSDGDTDAQEDKPKPKISPEDEQKRKGLEALKTILSEVKSDDLETARKVWEEHSNLLKSVPPVAYNFMAKLFQRRFNESPTKIEEAA